MKKSDFFIGLTSAILFAAGAAVAIRVYQGYQKGIDTYQSIENSFTEDPQDGEAETEDRSIAGERSEAGKGTGNGSSGMLPDDAPERISVDWEDLAYQYPDCVAWIQVPAVEISYPVMQSDDNDYYLHRAPDGSYLYAGSIFLEYQNNAAFSDQNSIIYGHNMRNGSMFGKLKQLNDPDVLDSCPYFWIYTPDVDYLYRIFSIHVVPKIGGAYRISFEDNEQFSEWIRDMAQLSDVETDAAVDENSSVITLSTCNGNNATRQVVQGVQVWAGSK